MSASDDMPRARQQGPLVGLRVVEFAGLGPAPFAAMLLADMGADVVRIDRPAEPGNDKAALAKQYDTFGRGRRVVRADLKDQADVWRVQYLVEQADVVIESFRPGVMERLQLGPENLMSSNPRLIYARISGWGQSGALSKMAGHDINYISMTGVLQSVGRAGEGPVVPLSLVGDFGGGAMFLLAGILAALYERQYSGQGQVVDASCSDGASMLMTVVHHMRAAGQWIDERGVNLFDSGSPYYNTYETADNRFLALGAIEPKFYAAMVAILRLDANEMHPQNQRSAWPWRKAVIAERVRTRTLDEWTAAFDGVDACVTPVLTPQEAATLAAHRERGAFVDVDGWLEPAPTPRFSRTPSRARPRSGRTVDFEDVWLMPDREFGQDDEGDQNE